MADYAVLYRESRERIGDLVRDLPAADLGRRVPGSPDWTVHGVVSHLAAIATDAMAGKLTGMPTPEQTAEQVRDRAGHPIADVLAEWAQSGALVEQAFAARAMPSNAMIDVITHEADLRGTLDAGRPPADAWLAALGAMRRHVDAVADRCTLVAGEQRWGSQDPVVEVDGYELWRAVLGRRSREQIAAWGRPELAERLPVFGPTTDPITD